MAREKALVTGGAGFIGHHLIDHLLEKTDWDLVCLDRLDTSGNLNRLNEVLERHDHRRFRFIFHDLKAEINELVGKQIGDPQYIFHLAASSHVDRSIVDPLSFVMDNVVGTCNVLNYARTLDNVKYINSWGTDEVFGDAKDGEAFEEWDRHFAKNPYSASKSGAESLSIAFYNTYKLPIVTTNCMNVFGERQHPEKFVPLVIGKLLRNEIIDIHCYPGRERAGSRFYIYSANVSDVSLYLTQKAIPGDKYNIVGQKEVSNLEMVNLIADIMGVTPQIRMVDFHSNRPGHDLRYALKDTKLGPMGYVYPFSFEESLEQTVKWTLQNHRWL